MLDEAKSILRLLLILYKLKGKELEQQDIFHQMSNIYGVGRRSSKTAIEVSEKLGLVHVKSKRGRGPRPSLLHRLTTKGEKIAKIILSLEVALREEVP